MRIGDIERVGEREIPMPTFKPQEPLAVPVPSPPAPRREQEPLEPESVPRT
jgi:hypothetical protein